MAFLGGDYNAEDHVNEFTPVPAGVYLAEAVKSSIKPTRKKDGSFLEFVFKIKEGEFEGKTATMRYNWSNPNPQAVEIGKKQFGDLCRACGNNAPNESAELHHITVQMTLGVESYKDKNDNEQFKNSVLAVEKRGTGPAAPAQEETPGWMQK